MLPIFWAISSLISSPVMLFFSLIHPRVPISYPRIPCLLPVTIPTPVSFQVSYCLIPLVNTYSSNSPSSPPEPPIYPFKLFIIPHLHLYPVEISCWRIISYIYSQQLCPSLASCPMVPGLFNLFYDCIFLFLFLFLKHPSTSSPILTHLMSLLSISLSILNDWKNSCMLPYLWLRSLLSLSWWVNFNVPREGQPVHLYTRSHSLLVSGIVLLSVSLLLHHWFFLLC